MKRLTYFDGGKWRLKIGDTEYSGKAVDRLAAYEDTGLEPETISKIRDIVLDISGDLDRGYCPREVAGLLHVAGRS